jgi:hypothetical protein
MPLQVLWRLGRAVRGQVAGRGGHHHAQRARDRNRDHVLLQRFAQAQAGVEAFGDQVDEAVVGHQVHADRWIGAHEVGQDRPQGDDHGRVGTGEPQRADRHVALLAHVVGGGVDFGQRRRHAGQQGGAGFGQSHPARRPLQQAHAKPVFQMAHGLRDGRGADPERCGSSRESAKLRHAREGRQGGQGIRVDCEVWLHDACSVARCFPVRRIAILALIQTRIHKESPDDDNAQAGPGWP